MCPLMRHSNNITLEVACTKCIILYLIWYKKCSYKCSVKRHCNEEAIFSSNSEANVSLVLHTY